MGLQGSPVSDINVLFSLVCPSLSDTVKPLIIVALYATDSNLDSLLSRTPVSWPGSERSREEMERRTQFYFNGLRAFSPSRNLELIMKRERKKKPQPRQPAWHPYADTIGWAQSGKRAVENIALAGSIVRQWVNGRFDLGEIEGTGVRISVMLAPSERSGLEFGAIPCFCTPRRAGCLDRSTLCSV